jgi:hypothetical protein
LLPAEKQEDWPSPAVTVQVATCGDQRLDDKQADVAMVAATGSRNKLQQQVAERFPDVFNTSKILPVATHGVEHLIVTSGPPSPKNFAIGPQKVSSGEE